MSQSIKPQTRVQVVKQRSKIAYHKRSKT